MKQHGTGCLYENEMQLNDNFCIPEMVLVVGFTFFNDCAVSQATK